LKFNLKEDESQTLIRYLSGLNDEIAHVVEPHPYASLDKLSVLARKVELQKRAKGKGMATKPNPHRYPFEKPSYNPLKLTLNSNTSPLHQISLKPPQNHLQRLVTRRDVFVVKAVGTLLLSVLTKELSLWPSIKLLVRSYKMRMKKEKRSFS